MTIPVLKLRKKVFLGYMRQRIYPGMGRRRLDLNALIFFRLDMFPMCCKLYLSYRLLTAMRNLEPLSYNQVVA